jgi:hypothetical protein
MTFRLARELRRTDLDLRCPVEKVKIGRSRSVLSRESLARRHGHEVSTRIFQIQSFLCHVRYSESNRHLLCRPLYF